MPQPLDPHTSETSQYRHLLAPHCSKGSGLDIGFGGDPITPSAITFDLPSPYTRVGTHPQHLAGHCSRLPFLSNTLDYIYSSHLVEDFTYKELSTQIIPEWYRVLRTGGNLVILAPNQQRFLAHCAATGQGTNDAHKEANFSFETFAALIDPSQFTLVESRPNLPPYSWAGIWKKR